LKARQLNKEEAIELLNQTEEAGLVHMAFNTTEDIEFLCNCDRWNCVVEGGGKSSCKLTWVLHNFFF
jgi:hypothetical protein